MPEAGEKGAFALFGKNAEKNSENGGKIFIQAEMRLFSEMLYIAEENI